MYAPRIEYNSLEDIYERIITTFLKERVGQTMGFLDPSLAANLSQNLLQLFNQNKFKSAGIGSELNYRTVTAFRSDVIHWLNRDKDDIFENAFFDQIDAFVLYLNKTCYTAITSYEFHYAYYAAGTFYKKHLDQFKDNKDRAYSLIMYLNEDWKMEDGGELKVYLPEGPQHISPRSGKCVFFKSDELEHEVLISNKPRMSITGWLKTG